MKKRVLSLLLALALLLTALPRLSLPARAEDDPVYSGQCGAQGGNLTWRFDPDTGTLSISGSGAMNGYSTTTAPWYSFRSAIVALDLPEGLTEIGSNAFCDCTGLASVSLPSTLTEISNSAFIGCTGLTSLSFPNSLTEIGHSAFLGCTGLASISFPDGLDFIGTAAFTNCSGLTELSLPGNIRFLGSSCFSGCSSLRSAVLGENLGRLPQNFFSDCTALETVEFSAGLISILAFAFSGCSSLRELALPEGLTDLDDSAFSNCCSLEHISLPASLCSLGDHVFAGCSSLREISMPDKAYRIGVGVFMNCTRLRSVKLSALLSGIPSRMFFSCRELESLTLPERLTFICEEAFRGSGLRSVSLPASLRAIDEDVFRDCPNLRALVFQDDSCLVCGLTVDPEATDEAMQRQERPDTLGGSSKTYLFLRQSDHPAGGAARVIQRKYSSLTQYAAEYGYRLCPLDSFRDVSPSAYYAVPVAWAVENGITTGAGSGSFRPKQVCAREQVVTFLWKAAGSPKPLSSQSPFSDVKPGKYYYSAVLWAVEKGITSGATAASFGVGKPCTREQVVSFLWKSLGSPAPAGTESPFTDVKPGKYYFNPVLWAVEQGITSGATPTTFGVGRPCTRAQVVTFLYNAYVLNG